MMVVNTGKHLDAALAAKLRELHQWAVDSRALGTMVFDRGPIEQRKPAQQKAWEFFHTEMNAAAVAAGLPEPRTHIDENGDECRVDYGANFETREILGWEPDEPEQLPLGEG